MAGTRVTTPAVVVLTPDYIRRVATLLADIGAEPDSVRTALLTAAGVSPEQEPELVEVDPNQTELFPVGGE